MVVVKILAPIAILSRFSVALSDLAYAGILFHLILSGMAHLSVARPILTAQRARRATAQLVTRDDGIAIGVVAQVGDALVVCASAPADRTGRTARLRCDRRVGIDRQCRRQRSCHGGLQKMTSQQAAIPLNDPGRWRTVVTHPTLT